jgi:hypothetical protein
MQLAGVVFLTVACLCHLRECSVLVRQTGVERSFSSKQVFEH